MQTVFWIWLVVAMKIPVAILFWMLWHIVRDVPEQVVVEEDGGSNMRVKSGPRRRGPHEGRGRDAAGTGRRGNVGHSETSTTRRRERLRQGN